MKLGQKLGQVSAKFTETPLNYAAKQKLGQKPGQLARFWPSLPKLSPIALGKKLDPTPGQFTLTKKNLARNLANWPGFGHGFRNLATSLGKHGLQKNGERYRGGLEKILERYRGGLEKIRERYRGGLEKIRERYRGGLEKIRERYRGGLEKIRERYRGGLEKIRERYRGGLEKIRERYRAGLEKCASATARGGGAEARAAGPVLAAAAVPLVVSAADRFCDIGHIAAMPFPFHWV